MLENSARGPVNRRPFCLLAGDLSHPTTCAVATMELLSQQRNWSWSRKQRRNDPNPLHDPPEPPPNDPPTEPLHDPPGDPTYEPRQPRTDPTPNPASDPPRELPRGVAW
jgi:hypothetical protein